MAKFGDDKEGFSIESVKGSVAVQAWGFWSAEFSKRFAPEVSAVLREVAPGAGIVLDVADLRPLRDEGQRAFHDLLNQALESGVKEVVIRSPSALTKLQMMRLARLAGENAPIRVE